MPVTGGDDFLTKKDAKLLAEKLLSREWRLENLYKIRNKNGEEVPFKLNPAQRKLVANLHTKNLILKARQLGFSTFILVMALDICLFNDGTKAGLVADTEKNAKALLERVRFAYNSAPAWLKAEIPVKEPNNATQITFDNDSLIVSGVTLRSMTTNFLHISEYGIVCAKSPDRAEAIKSGALNTVGEGHFVFIESTAEGRAGDFFDKCESARNRQLSGIEPSPEEYKLHFFGWYEDPSYVRSTPMKLTDEDEKYFEGLKDEHGIELTDQQKWWYVTKRDEQGDGMFKEFPSTPEEAFLASNDGAYFAKQIMALRQTGQIGDFPLEPRTTVNTFWDLGVDDDTCIWLHQVILGKHRFVGYIENSGEPIGFYINELERWRTRHNATFGEHYAPHDVDNRTMAGAGETIRDTARRLGLNFRVVKRTTDKLNTIQRVRDVLPKCQFAIPAVDKGLTHLESYTREWDDRNGVWKTKPKHDEHSHASDAFMTFADGWIDPKPPPKFRRRKGIL